MGLYRAHSDQSEWLPRLIWALTGPTSIGVMASYADLSLYLTHSDSSDGCLRWSQSLLGTQWSE